MAYLFREKSETLNGTIRSKHVDELLTRHSAVKVADPKRASGGL